MDPRGEEFHEESNKDHFTSSPTVRNMTNYVCWNKFNLFFFNCKRAFILFFSLFSFYIYWNLFDFDEPTPLCCFFVFGCNGMTLVCIFIFETHQCVCYIELCAAMA